MDDADTTEQTKARYLQKQTKNVRFTDIPVGGRGSASLTWTGYG